MEGRDSGSFSEEILRTKFHVDYLVCRAGGGKRDRMVCQELQLDRMPRDSERSSGGYGRVYAFLLLLQCCLGLSHDVSGTSFHLCANVMNCMMQVSS